MSERRFQNPAERLGKNVRRLRTELDLTVQGLAEASGISVNHVRMIETGKSNVTLFTAAKLAELAGLDISELLAPRMPKLSPIHQLPLYKAFCEENRNNKQYFLSKKGDGSVAHFIKAVLLPEGHLREEKEVWEIAKECLEIYKQRFSSKDLSRQLRRLADKGILIKRDKTGKGKRFGYREAPN